MVGFVKTYGVADEDVRPLIDQLNVVHKKGKLSLLLNASNPCGKHVKTLKDMRSCRYRIAAHFPGLRGCMTKMVLGRQCAERFKLTIADLNEAKRVLREEFAFVGITEKWHESVKLFHELHGGKLHADEMFGLFRTSPPAISNVKRALYNTYDYFDEELYLTALEVFEVQKRTVAARLREGQNAVT